MAIDAHGTLETEGLACQRGACVKCDEALRLAAKPHERVPRTTQSNHDFQRFSNLVDGLKLSRPDEVWVADSTYARLPSGFVSSAVLMDVFTRTIRGWELGYSLEGSLTLTALNRALRRSIPEVHHSDQRVQYAGLAYVKQLRSKGVKFIIAHASCPEENGYAELLMKKIKEVEVALSDYKDLSDV